MATESEFPCLTENGLYALNIPGDGKSSSMGTSKFCENAYLIPDPGNCLFSALSDQIYGSISQHAEIRARTISYMKEHKDYYVQFIDVIPGGGTRRQPKRKAANAYSTIVPTPEDIDRAFDHYITQMARGGTYGDNMEIVAFSACYEVDVRIYQAFSSYIVSAPSRRPGKATAHIAYHASYLHYSSVRNIDGPHSGLPEVNAPMIDGSGSTRSEIRSHPQWVIKTVMQSAWLPISEEDAIRALTACDGDVDGAIEYILETQDTAENSPDPYSLQSSSVERDLGSDEENIDLPKKRQDRRLSRARQDRKKKSLSAKLRGLDDDSLESLIGAKSNVTALASQPHADTGDSDDEEMSLPPPLYDGTTSSDSDYSPPPAPSTPKPGPKITIKLSAKPPESQPSTGAQAQLKLVNKSGSPQKRLNSARDIKNLKKQAQNQAAKERRRQQAAAASNAATAPPGQPTSSESSFGSQPIVTNGFRTMHI